MKFLKNLLFNLILLLGVGILLFSLYPNTMKHFYSLFGQLFGPLAMIVLVVWALPEHNKKAE